jgi:hypothetical protein
MERNITTLFAIMSDIFAALMQQMYVAGSIERLHARKQ